MIDLLKDEIMSLYPENNRVHDAYYHLHCSPRVADHLKGEFMNLIKGSYSSFVIDRTDEEPDPNASAFIRYSIPGVGMLNVLMDMLQGYRIEKIENQINKQEIE
jgi:hypothetical protein